MSAPYELFLGKNYDVLPAFGENVFDACVTDPPYGLKFMGKRWDYQVPSVAEWRVILNSMKPGAYLLAFGGARTFHRMAVNIEDAGFEIRDTLMWLYGQGFPKSLDVSKALDKAAGAEREVIGVKPGHEGFANRGTSSVQSFKGTLGGAGGFDRPWMEDPSKVERYHSATAPASELAKRYAGFGTALKPAHEPIVLARKPLEGTVAENVVRWGTGGLNVDGCRIETNPDVDDARLGGQGAWRTDKAAKNVYEGGYEGKDIASSNLGRYPANVLHDGSEEVRARFPEAGGQQGDLKNHAKKRKSKHGIYGELEAARDHAKRSEADRSAARFFYCPKTSRQDRNEGCEHLASTPLNWSNGEQNPGAFQSEGTDRTSPNAHPTVKPTELMRYLVRLVTPPQGLVLDPYAGSGSTGKAALLEGFGFVGIDDEDVEVARARCEHAWRRVDSHA